MNGSKQEDSAFSEDCFCDRHDRSKVGEIKTEWLRLGGRPYRSYIKLKSNILYCYGNSLDVHGFLSSFVKSSKFRIICQFTNESQEDCRRMLFYKACFAFCHVEDVLRLSLDQDIVALHLKHNNIESLA